MPEGLPVGQLAEPETAVANGMKKIKEYPDGKNEISYAYAITRKNGVCLNDKCVLIKYLIVIIESRE